MGPQRTHQGLFGQDSGGFHRSGHPDPYQERRAGVGSVGVHPFQDELGDSFIPFPGHQHHGMARQGAAAPSHVGIDFAGIRIRDDFPEHGGRPLPYVLAGVVFIESFYAVVAQRGSKGSLDGGFLQQPFQFPDEREVGAAFHEILEHPSILAGRAVQVLGQLLVLGVGFIQQLGDGHRFLFGQFLQFGGHIIGQHLGGVADELGHDVGHLFHLGFFGHFQFLLILEHTDCFLFIDSGSIRDRRGTGWAAGSGRRYSR